MKINFHSFPPLGLLPDTVTTLVEKHTEILERADTIGARLVELVTGNAGADAAEQDRIATVAAIEAGGTEPITEARDAHNAEVRAVRNESTALHKTLDDLTARIITTITAEAPALLDAIPEMKDKAHRSYTRAIDNLTAARAAYHHVSEFQRWLELFTADDTRNTHAAFLSDDTGLVIRHNRPGQATYTHEEMVDAYRYDLAEPVKVHNTNPWK